MDSVTADRVEKALLFLAESDAKYAEAKANLESAEILRKRVRSRVFLTSEGTVAERQATADCDDQTVVADDAYIAAVEAFEKLRAQRQRAELLVEVWRSLESSRRKGMV